MVRTQVSQVTTHPQSTHHPIYIDLVPHVNHDQYTDQQHVTEPQGITHPQSTYISTYDDLMPHAKPQDQYVSQPPCIDPSTSHSKTMHCSIYVDSGLHDVMNSQDQYTDLNQPLCIVPGTSHPQSVHDSVYVDSGGHMNPHDQHTNQSHDIVPQGPPYPQNTHRLACIDSVPHVNPDDQYTNQQCDTDLQAISHPQIMHVSTYNDSMPHAKPHNQSSNHSNFSDDHPGPEQFTLASQTTHYPPAHGFVSDTYYHTPHPKMSYERPDPLIQSSDWMHGLFDVHNAGNGVEGGPSVDLEPAAKHHHDFNHLCYHRTSSQHTPYTVSKRCNDYLTPRDVEHGEGSSHSTAQSVLPLVLDTQPVTVPSPVVPKAPSPIPVALPQSVLNSWTSVVFGVADLSKVKSAALFQMKCTIFINSFFLDVATVGKMARKCMDAKVSHDGKLLKLTIRDCHWLSWCVDDLVAWSKTSDSELEVSKLCKALGTIKKNIQFLSHSAVLWGYDPHYLLMEKPKKEVKEFVCRLIKNNIFLFGVIDASRCLPLSCAWMLMLFFLDSRQESGNHLREYRNQILRLTTLPSWQEVHKLCWARPKHSACVELYQCIVQLGAQWTVDWRVQGPGF